ncbi:hypothetical protein FHX57_006769 [Paraburkholderia tropica]|uniref:hypothetical protein n=1 Tax=Paraburkholderia tropica TaxID=92647 RepID=UPI00160A04AC|nr:hypothetical protein [Paraburkholderia tropica]MBB3004387.1 hypothetical protein [Paraburkholderia tropica]
MTIDLEKLEELAKGALWTGDWYDAGCNTVMCKYPDGGDFAGECDEIAHPCPTGITRFMAAAQPKAILELIAEVRRLRETTRLQANAARTGMDAAKRAATILYAEADKARAESSPDVLASERAMNAMLTEENEVLRIDADRYRRLKSFADPSYNIRTMSNAHSASLAKEEFLTVHAGSWEAMDAVLDGVVTVNTVNIKEWS